jgi:ornithine cyclodeaminase
MKIISLDQIKGILAGSNSAELLKAIEDGFVMYAEGKVIVPPVGHLGFTDPPGDLHIKYGRIEGDDYYVIKIASGFYDNPKHGLPPGNGMMMVFNARTGEPLAILQDEGVLTDIRTAIAGAVCAKYLAPATVTRIGIVGTGVQARLQLQYLKAVTDCRDVIVWGRSLEKAEALVNDPTLSEFTVKATTDMNELAGTCNLIVTTTASREPLLMADQVRPGTHITAMGADAAGKQELDAALFAKADLVVADSIDQCVDHGDICHAVKSGHLSVDKIVSLGDIVKAGRPSDGSGQQISIADLTGVAIQDIQIAKFVYNTFEPHPPTPSPSKL